VALVPVACQAVCQAVECPVALEVRQVDKEVMVLLLRKWIKLEKGFNLVHLLCGTSYLKRL
jgi:hypothetical protein